MATGFAAAQELGGCVVRIGADTSGLRAGEQQARAVAQAIGRTRAVVKVALDVSALKAGLQQIQAMARALPPIKIPVQLVGPGGGGFGGGTIGATSPYGGGQNLLPGGSRLSPQSITINSGQRMLPGPQTTALSTAVNSGGWTGGSPYTSLGGQPINYSGFTGSRMGTSSGRSSAAGSPPGGSGGERSATGGMGILGKFVAAEAIAHTVGGTLRDISQAGNLRAQIIAGQGASLSGYQLAIADGRQSLPTAIFGNTPIVGNIVKGGFDIATASTLGEAAVQNAQSDLRQTQIERAKATNASMQALQDQMFATATNTISRDAMTAHDPTRALEAQLSEQRRQLEETIRKSPDAYAMGQIAPSLRKNLAEEQASQRQALAVQIYENRFGVELSSQAGQVQAGYAIAASGTGVGSADQSFALGQAGARQGLIDRQAGEMFAEKDRTNQATLARKQAAELQALDAQQAQARVERERDTQNRLIAIRSEGAAAALTADRRGNDAELAAYDEGARQRENAVRNASAAEQQAVGQANYQGRRAIMRRQEDSQIATMIGFGANANSAELMAAGRGREAAIASFDAETEIGELQQQAQNVAAYRESRGRVRAAMVQGQERDRAIFSIGIEGRTAAAKFRAGGMAGTAGIASLIAQQQMELKEPREPAERIAIAGAQLEELKAMKADISRPRTFASEFDPNRQVVGGPGGDVARDQLGVMRSIDNRIRDLTNALKNPVVLNN